MMKDVKPSWGCGNMCWSHLKRIDRGFTAELHAYKNRGSGSDHTLYEVRGARERNLKVIFRNSILQVRT